MEQLIGLDFFDAMRIALGTTRWIKYTGGLGVAQKWFLKSELFKGLTLVDEDGKKWWPSDMIIKEKAWEVASKEDASRKYWRVLINCLKGFSVGDIVFYDKNRNCYVSKNTSNSIVIEGEIFNKLSEYFVENTEEKYENT